MIVDEKERKERSMKNGGIKEVGKMRNEKNEEERKITESRKSEV